MSQVEKLEALLSKVQANRQLPRSSGMHASPTSVSPASVSPGPVSVSPSSIPAPLASQSPISVAPPRDSEPSLLSEPVTSVAPEPAARDSEPSIEIGAPSDLQLSPEPVDMPQVLSESGSPWAVVGASAPTPVPATFVELLDRSLSLKPR